MINHSDISYEMRYNQAPQAARFFCLVDDG